MRSPQGACPGGIPDCERPVLLALTSTGSLLAYQAFTTAPLAGMGVGVGGGFGTGAEADGLALSLAACTALGGGGGGGAVAFRRLPLDSLSHEQPAAAGGTAGGARMVRFDNLAYTDPVHKVGGGTGLYEAGLIIPGDALGETGPNARSWPLPLRVRSGLRTFA